MYEGSSVVKLLCGGSDAYTHPVNSWARDQRGKLFCRNCFKLRREVFPRPINVPLRELPKGILYDSVFQAAVGVMQIHLLDLLRPHLPEHSLGRCLGRDGSPLPEYRSIYFRDSILIRAGEQSRNYFIYTCDVCGIVAQGSDESYVLRTEMPEAEIFQDDICSLYLSESMAHTLPWKELQDVEAFAFPVRDEVLPDDPLPRGWRAVPSKDAWLTSPGDIEPERLFVAEPDRYANLRATAPRLERLEDDSAASCPVPMAEILDYLRLERDACEVTPKDLCFVRTARIKDRSYWLWNLDEQVTAGTYVMVWRADDGTACIGCRGNSARLTPDEFIYGDYHGLL